jgi:hypothetical protein
MKDPNSHFVKNSLQIFLMKEKLIVLKGSNLQCKELMRIISLGGGLPEGAGDQQARVGQGSS